MTHYQKLATMIFRIIGGFFMLTGAVFLAVFLLFGLLVPFMSTMTVPFTLIYSLPLVLLGIFFYSTSSFFARWVTVGFDEW
jgi:hypothetical protein